MFVLEANIQIGGFSFKSIHDVEITKSVDDLLDTALIKLPTRFKVRSSGEEKYTERAIKVGDAVTITLGYENVISTVEFKGYVSKVSPKVPLEIHCEDAMWLLRRKSITKSFNDLTDIKEILKEVVSGTALQLADDIPDVPLEKWIIKNANGCQVLQKMKQELGLSFFIDDDDRLFVGLQQSRNIGQIATYDLNYNLIENNLEFRTSEQRLIKVRYTYINGKNKRTKVEVGDPDGDLRTFHTSVVSSESKLRALAEAELLRLKYEGFDGDVVSFLTPFATRGMTANIIDKEHPNRDGSYFIKKVVVSYGMSGARRKVEIGNKL